MMRKNIGYEELANAVVEQAVRDYVRAIVKLQRVPLDRPSYRTYVEVEAFFASSWLTMFTTIDGSVLLSYAKKIAKEEILRKMKSRRCRSYSAFID